MKIEDIDVSCTSNREALKDGWIELEKEGICTPYQQYAWIDAFASHISTGNNCEHCFVSVLCKERIVAILPLSISQRFGIRELSWLGNKHSNYHGGIYDRDFLQWLDEPAFKKIWKKIKTALPPFDLLWMSAQLAQIEGHRSPFFWLKSAPSANTSHVMRYPHHDWPEILRSSRSKKTRKRMRNEESRLSREGEIAHRVLDNEDDVDSYVRQMLEQRAERMKLLGIDTQEELEEYFVLFSEMLKSSLSNGDTKTRMIVLTLDDILLAAIVLFTWRNSYYPLINSITATRYQSWSPGEYLLRIMMILGCEEKISSVDYGPGEDVYKTSWCNTDVAMVETMAAQTLRGYLAVSGIRSFVWLKRSIKNNETIWSLYRNLRRRLNGSSNDKEKPPLNTETPAS